MVNKRLHDRLSDISEEYPDAVFRWAYVDWPEGSWSLPCRLKADRIDRVCDDHSVEAVQVLRVDGGEWSQLYPDPPGQSKLVGEQESE